MFLVLLNEVSENPHCTKDYLQYSEGSQLGQTKEALEAMKKNWVHTFGKEIYSL
jgi:hypothetical protein